MVNAKLSYRHNCFRGIEERVLVYVMFVPQPLSIVEYYTVCLPGGAVRLNDLGPKLRL
jgi:hypothetical protein